MKTKTTSTADESHSWLKASPHYVFILINDTTRTCTDMSQIGAAVFSPFLSFHLSRFPILLISANVWNILIKFLCLSSWDLFIFTIRLSSFIPIYIICMSMCYTNLFWICHVFCVFSFFNVLSFSLLNMQPIHFQYLISFQISDILHSSLFEMVLDHHTLNI